MDLKKLEKFTGNMDIQTFCGWIEYVSGRMFETGESIAIPGRFQNAHIRKNHDGTFKVESNSFWRTIYYEFTALYFTKEGNAFQSEIAVNENDVKVGKWKKTKGFVNTETAFIINSKEEIDEILKRTNPYAYHYAKNRDYPNAAFIVSPELELLLKAGYTFADHLLRTLKNRYNDEMIKAYNRLCVNNGKNIKEIFKTDKCVYSALRNESYLTVWDNYRRMYKKGRLTAQDIEDVYGGGYTERDLKCIDEILRKNVDGKPFFTLKTLLRYLEKIDRYEAISFEEGIDLLRDYLSMCIQLDMKPNLTSDSLKREHDVTARIFRTKKDEILDSEMKKPCEEAARFNYSEGTFFIRSIEGYDDLLDEAKQQRNCVASYGNAIASGRTMVFTMRQRKFPNKSVATVELTKTGEIRQARLAFNKPVTNKAQNDFLKRWRKHVLDIMHGLFV